MGASLSSPQLGNGLISAPGPDALGPFATAFYVAATDTSSLGFTASVYWGTAMEARYTDTAGVERTVGCSDSPDPDPNQRNPFSVSILCPVANTQLGTGPVIFSLAGDGPATYAIFVGQTTATVGPDPITTTAIVPGLTTYLATVTSTVYETTETVAITTTLTGQYSASHCPTLRTTSPTTLSTSTRSASTSSHSSKISSSTLPSSTSLHRASSSTTSSVRSSHQTGSASASVSTRLSSASSTKISRSSFLAHSLSYIEISSSSRMTSSSQVALRSTSLKKSSLPTTASLSKAKSSAKTSSLPRSGTSRSSMIASNTSKFTSPKDTSKATSKATSKTSSKSTSSSKVTPSPLCSMGLALEPLYSYPSIASHLCQEVLSTKLSFPSSISVWPASQLSSACSCFRKFSSTKVARQTKGALFRRTRAAVETTSASSSLEVSNTDAAFSNSSSVSSSPTTTFPTTVAGYGPPTMYSVLTTTFTTPRTDTVYVTNNRTVLPTTTAIISIGTTTVTTNSTVTIDHRILPKTCITDSEDTKVTLSARSLTCTNLKLHTAFLWVMMKDPFDFCAYYLTANRNTSPLLEMSAGTLKDTCSCLMVHNSAPLPAFKVGPPYSPKPKRQCNQSVASLIKAKFEEPKTFCKYYTSTSRNISPLSVLKPGDVFAGCSCLI